MSVFIVIPAFREKGVLIDTLTSLNRSYITLSSDQKEKTRVIVVLNRPQEIAFSSDDKATKEELMSFSGKHPLPIHIIDVCEKGLAFGVGEARKLGFDECIKHASPTDLFVSLDADTLVPANYFHKLHERPLNPRYSGFLVEFAHPLSSENEFLAFYELYLCYLRDGLRRAGSPFAFIAMGSTLGTNAYFYGLSGGMVCKNATEDYHFMNKLRKYGEIDHWQDIIVQPSSRLSQRVTLGTGYFLNRCATLGLEEIYRTLLIPSAAHFQTLSTFLRLLQDSFRNIDVWHLGVAAYKTVVSPKVLAKLEQVILTVKQEKDFKLRVLQIFDGLQSLRFLRVLRSQSEEATLNEVKEWMCCSLNLQSNSWVDMAREHQIRRQAGNSF